MNHIESTRYGYKSADGTRLEVQSDMITGQEFYICVWHAGAVLQESVTIPVDQAPAVALAILAAAGVQSHTGTALVRGDRRDMWVVRYLTEHVEAQAEDAAEKELTRRRDELADEFTAVSTYGGQLPYVQKMLDRIIQLQDQAAK